MKEIMLGLLDEAFVKANTEMDETAWEEEQQRYRALETEIENASDGQLLKIAHKNRDIFPDVQERALNT